MPEDALLDAAAQCVLTAGIRRTTLTAVARAAGVSRMTVYRRFSDVSALLAALMTREFGIVLQRAARQSDGATARHRLVNATVTAVAELASHQLLRSVVDHDPQLLLPYLTARIGATQRIAETFLADRLSEGHAEGSIRPARAAVQARAVLLTAQSFVLGLHLDPHPDDPVTVGTTELLDELRRHLDAALRPEIRS